MPSSVTCDARFSNNRSDIAGATVTHSLASEISFFPALTFATSGMIAEVLNSSTGVEQEIISSNEKRLIEYFMGLVFNKNNV